MRLLTLSHPDLEEFNKLVNESLASKKGYPDIENPSRDILEMMADIVMASLNLAVDRSLLPEESAKSIQLLGMIKTHIRFAMMSIYFVCSSAAEDQSARDLLNE